MADHATPRLPREAHAAHHSVILFNKPYRVLCQFSGDGTRRTLKDFIDVPHVYPAGRLDADSEGLVVLTSSGPLQARIADPRYKLTKTYWVQVEGEPSSAQLGVLADGVDLSDGRSRPARVTALPAEHRVWIRNPPIRARKTIPATWLQLEITEGRNRQVRRMTAAVGLPTLRLIRFAIGEWTVDDLAPGKWRSAAVL